MPTTKITIQAAIVAPVEKAWESYTDPKHIMKWNFASDDWQCPAASNDLRVGGRYFARMEAKDGSFGFDFEAIYSEVKAAEKITYTMGDGREATVVFEDNGSKTNVTVSFDPESVNSLELQRNGWQAILDNYKKYTEGT
jgi:uncharacterized protein YndB with AHSA1/START domain